jgi:hypothetical protein
VGVAVLGFFWAHVDPLDRINNHKESRSKLKINLQGKGVVKHTFLQI